MSKRRIIRNAARCRKCGDEIESKSRHDYRVCSCGSIAVDGGLNYIRRAGEMGDIEELSEWDEPDEDEDHRERGQTSISNRP